MARYNINSYYLNDLDKLYQFLVPTDSESLRIRNGRIESRGKFDYIILDNVIGDVEDVQSFFSRVKNLCRGNSRLIVTYYNHLWEPILKLASFLGLRRKVGEQNWLGNEDIVNLLNLSGFESITTQKRLLIPIYIPILSDLVNRWLANLPIINSLCLITFIIAKPKAKGGKDCSISIIVPARNEELNIPRIIPSIPNFGSSQEVIFVEGHSKDETWKAIRKEVSRKNPAHIPVRAYRQQGKGKADAVRLGFSKASGEILMILDADLTVDPKELKKFYAALISAKGDFANGSRLVYPMENQAMQTLNKLANKIFSMLFTFILGQRFKDTLCGTKALFKKDYGKITLDKDYKNLDPFGDFGLIFGAVKNNLKIVEIPVRYKERKYGKTNITRFSHGIMLLVVTVYAFKKFKAW